MGSNSPASSIFFSPTGELPSFVNLEERHKCPLCHHVLRNPYQTECGHRICYDCILDLLDREGDPSPCPFADVDKCEEQVGRASIYKDGFASREIMNLPVFCQYQKFGCQEHISWKELEKHESMCRYAVAICPNEGCDEYLKNNEKENHLKNECRYRPLHCGECREEFPAASMAHHQEVQCPYTMIKCPNDCGQKVKRIEMEDHLERCPKQPQKCRFPGCDFLGNEQELKKHMNSDDRRHLECAVMAFTQLDEKNMDLKKIVQNQACKIDDMTRLTTVLQKTCDGLQHQHGEAQKQIKKNKLLIAQQGERCITLETQMKGLQGASSSGESASEILVLQETAKVHENRLTYVERTTESLTTQNSQMDRQGAIHDVRLAEHDLRFQVMETANHEGLLIWKIQDYRRRKQEAMAGRTVSLYSQPFYTSRYGYKMCARVYLNGDGVGKGTHMSLFFVVMKGCYDALLEWPFHQKVTLMLLDQDTGRRHLSDTFRPDPSSTSFKRPVADMNIASGCPLFVSQTIVETETYLRDDTLFIKVLVDTDGGGPRF